VISSRRGVWFALCGIVALLGLAGACTNSEDLGSGIDRLVVDVELQNPTTRFAVAGLLLNQITARPLDPVADQVLGPNPLALVASTTGGTDIDFNGAQTSFEFGTTLPEGTYRIESIIFEILQFQQGTPSANAMNCVGNVTTYPLQSATVFPDQQTFTITEGSDRNRVRVILDGAALADAFEQSWTCGCLFSGNCLSITSCAPTQRCGQTFRDGDFANLSSTYLQVQSNQ
jgi:hypothetical protein